MHTGSAAGNEYDPGIAAAAGGGEGYGAAPGTVVSITGGGVPGAATGTVAGATTCTGAGVAPTGGDGAGSGPGATDGDGDDPVATIGDGADAAPGATTGDGVVVWASPGRAQVKTRTHIANSDDRQRAHSFGMIDAEHCQGVLRRQCRIASRPTSRTGLRTFVYARTTWWRARVTATYSARRDAASSG